MSSIKTGSTSTIEKLLATKSTFRRNRKLIDIRKFDSLMVEQQVQRRKPFFSSQSHVDYKIKQAFLDSTLAQSVRVDKDINKFKRRISVQSTHASYVDLGSQTIQDANKGQELSRVLKARNAISMEKMLSRDYVNSINTQQIDDQRLFNNFNQAEPDSEHVPNFTKYLGRPSITQPVETLSISDSLEVQKTYNKFFHRSLPTKCIFDYKTQRKQYGRVYSVEKKTSDLPQQIDRSLVLRALCATEVPAPAAQFYRYGGRERPSNLDQRFMRPATNFYKYNRVHMKEADFIKQFQVKRIKADLIDKKISQIRKKKQSRKFKKHELCDAMFYRLSQKQRCDK